MTSKAARLFIGSFAIACILIGTLAGFLIVDMSTDRYMPGTFAPILQVSGVGEEGVEFAFFGERYLIHSGQVMEVQAAVWEWRGLLPRSLRVAGVVAVEVYDWVSGLWSGGA